MTFDYYTLIGNIVVSFQSLEFSLKTMIAELTNMDEEIALTITAEMSFSNVLNLLKDLSAIKFKENKEINDKINELIGKMKVILQKRNDVVHSYYFDEIRGDDKTVKSRMRKRYNSHHKIESKVLTQQELLDIIKEMMNVYTDLSFFYTEYLMNEIKKSEII